MIRVRHVASKATAVIAALVVLGLCPKSIKTADASEVIEAPHASSTNDKIVHELSKKYSQSEEVIRHILSEVGRHVSPTFPRKEDLLALIAVESKFNPTAKDGKSKGVTQVNVGFHYLPNPYQIGANIAKGVEILKGCYETAGRSRKGAFLCYNAGEGAYLKGRYNISYFQKINQESKWMSTLTQGANDGNTYRGSTNRDSVRSTVPVRPGIHRSGHRIDVPRDRKPLRQVTRSKKR